MSVMSPIGASVLVVALALQRLFALTAASGSLTQLKKGFDLSSRRMTAVIVPNVSKFVRHLRMIIQKTICDPEFFRN
jgi:hypothetical protein